MNLRCERYIFALCVNTSFDMYYFTLYANNSCRYKGKYMHVNGNDDQVIFIHRSNSI